MSDERDGTTGFADRGAPSTGSDQAGATAVPDPRTEGRPPAAQSPGPQTAVLPVPAAQGAGAAGPAAQGPAHQEAAGPGSAPQAQLPPVQGPPPPVPPTPVTGAESVPTGPPAEPGTEAQPGGHPTVPVRARPRPRVPSRDQMIRMGPWAPVAGAAVGLLLGIVVVLLLAPAVSGFAERLSLVFVVLGMTLLGAGGTLLADEVRLLRRGTQAAEVRSSSAEAIAGLLNGLTPARLLLTVSAFVLLLSAYVTTRG